MEDLPELLELFELCIQQFTTRDDIGVAIDGSVCRGTLDSYSDLDFEVIVRSDAEIDRLRSWVWETIGSIAPRLAHFPATHLGLSNLLIFFFKKDDKVVKVDVSVLTLEDFANHFDALIVYDPGKFLATFRATVDTTKAHLPDFEDLYHKFCGWIWYTYTKIARGEYLEARDSLELMRSYALLPSLLFLEELPQEGYRRLENRLSSERLSALIQTLPSSIEQNELMRTLIKLTELFSEIQPLVAEKLGREHRTADLREMIHLVTHLASDESSS